MTPASDTTKLVVLRTLVPGDARLSAEELARAAAISASTLRRLIRHGLVEPDPAAPDSFPAAAAVRLARMLRLHDDLELDLEAAAIIVELLERLDRLEADLRRLGAGPNPERG